MNYVYFRYRISSDDLFVRKSVDYMTFVRGMQLMTEKKTYTKINHIMNYIVDSRSKQIFIVHRSLIEHTI